MSLISLPCEGGVSFHPGWGGEGDLSRLPFLFQSICCEILFFPVQVIFSRKCYTALSPSRKEFFRSRKSCHSSKNVSLVFLIDTASSSDTTKTTTTRDISDFTILLYFRTIESLYEELVHEGILVRAPRIKLSEYTGEYR